MSDQNKDTKGYNEELNETLRRLDNEIEKTPNDIGLYHIKIALLAEVKQVDEILKLMDKVLEIDANDTKTLHDKGEILFKMGRFNDAFKYYNKAVEIDNEMIKSWQGRGLALIKLRNLEFEDDLDILDKERRVQLEDALDSLTMVTDRNPKLLLAWNGKGHVLYTLHRYDEALECFNRCTKIKSDFISAWYGRGKVLKKMDRQAEAIQSFQTAVDCIGSNVILKDIDTLICWANSYLELGQDSEAVDCINRFLEKDPNNPIALAGKGDILERIGRKTEALQCYKKSTKLESNRAYVWFKLGNLKNERGEFETALKCYYEAVKHIPGFEEAWFKIGEVLTIENKDEQAKECYSRILKINPDNVKAQKAMGTFENKKETHVSLFKRGRRKHKDGKKRKKRKRRKEKPKGTPSQKNTTKNKSRKTKSELIFEEEIPNEIQEDYKIMGSNPETEKNDELPENPMNEINQSPELLEEGMGQLISSSMDEQVREIESELQILEDCSYDEDPRDDINTGLEELQELLNGDTEKEVLSEKEGNLNKNQAKVEHPKEKELVEKDTDSYGDLGEELAELERLLTEKADYMEVPDEEENQSKVLPQDTNVPLESEEGQRVPGLEDLESNLDELQDLLATDNAHLDGQKYATKTIEQDHLDGHQIKDINKLDGMDAHSSDYTPPANIQQSLAALMDKGKKHMQKGEFKKAMNFFDKILEIDPLYVDALGAKFDILIEMEEQEE